MRARIDRVYTRIRIVRTRTHNLHMHAPISYVYAYVHTYAYSVRIVRAHALYFVRKFCQPGRARSIDFTGTKDFDHMHADRAAGAMIRAKNVFEFFVI